MYRSGSLLYETELSHVTHISSILSRNVGRKPPEYYLDPDEKTRSDSRTQSDMASPPVLVRFVSSFQFRVAVSAVIFVSVALVIHESDLRAADTEIPEWLKYLNNAILLFYILEVSLRICAFSLAFFLYIENLFDVFVVVSDTVLEFLEHTKVLDGGSVGFLRLFRALRIIRILRLAVYFSVFRELYLMLHGFVNVLRALFWAICLLCIVLTMWAIVAVDVLHPLNKDLFLDGVYPDGCYNCRQAYSSVFRAILTSIQGMIAGDAWGEVAVPIITAHPWTIVIFVMMLVTVQLGLLNLVLSVIVDRAMEARETDEEQIMNHRNIEKHKTERRLKRLCESMDTDGDGIISLDEMRNAFEANPAFVQAVGSLGIDVADLNSLFAVLDDDDSGNIDFSEFIEKIHQMRCTDIRAQTVFIKHFTGKALPENIMYLKDKVIHLSAALDRLRETMQNVAGHMGISNSLDVGAHSSGGTSSAAFLDSSRLPVARVEPVPPKTLPVRPVDYASTIESQFGKARLLESAQKFGLDNRGGIIKSWQQVPECIEQNFMEFKHVAEAEFQRFILTANDIVMQASRLPPTAQTLDGFSIGPSTRADIGLFTPPTGLPSVLLSRPQRSKAPRVDRQLCSECGSKGCKASGHDASNGLLKVCGTPVSCERVGGGYMDRTVVNTGPMPTPSPSPFAVD